MLLHIFAKSASLKLTLIGYSPVAWNKRKLVCCILCITVLQVFGDHIHVSPSPLFQIASHLFCPTWLKKTSWSLNAHPQLKFCFLALCGDLMTHCWLIHTLQRGRSLKSSMMELIHFTKQNIPKTQQLLLGLRAHYSVAERMSNYLSLKGFPEAELRKNFAWGHREILAVKTDCTGLEESMVWLIIWPLHVSICTCPAFCRSYREKLSPQTEREVN